MNYTITFLTSKDLIAYVDISSCIRYHADYFVVEMSVT